MATPSAVRYGTYDPATDPFGGAYAADLQAANKRGWRDAGIASGIGAAGEAAQLGLTLVDTAQDTENAKRLAELSRHVGLSEGERRDIDEQAARGVKVLSAQRQRRTEDAMASGGGRSAAELQESRRTSEKAVNEASIEAADIGIRENRAQVIRDRQEKQERIAYESERERQRIAMIGNAIGGLAQQFGKIYAQNPEQVAPSDAQWDAMRTARDAEGKPIYQGLQDISNDAARAAWERDYRARVASQDAAGLR
jgi:hypothetical protein